MPTHTRLLLIPTLALAAAATLAQAPIERPSTNNPHTPAIHVLRPAPGLTARVSADGSLRTVSATADKTELRLERGVANISVFHPASDAQLLIDLPNGQTALLKDGLYTFNAQTNTVRVLKGEAEAFAGMAPEAKGIKVKEDHQLAFANASLRSVEVLPAQARADLLPSPEGYRHVAEPRYGRGYGDGFYGGGFYGDGFGYPYSPYYAYGFGYPGYGFGYPGFGYGLGFGYGYGFGYRGGYGRRFR